MTDYTALIPFLVENEIDFMVVRGAALERLIEVKRAAGRPKDLEAIAELQQILEERREE